MLTVLDIMHIGKEANDLEKSGIFGVSESDTLEYVDFQKKLRKIIESLTLEKALMMNISRRSFFYLKKKIMSSEPLVLKQKILQKLMSLF